MKNDDPFLPWNNPMYKDYPFAAHNNLMDKDNPFKPWNSPFGREEDLTNDEAATYDIKRRREDEGERIWGRDY